MNVPKISDAEMELMKLIWKAGKPVTAGELQEKLKTDWKPTTILTLAGRLAGKRIIRVEKQGRTNYYSPLLSETEYKAQQAEVFLKELHSGSVKNFMAALYNGKKISKGQLEELKRWLEEV